MSIEIVFNEKIMNIMSNFVPNKLNHYTKNVIIAINDFHRKFVLSSSSMGNHLIIQNLQSQLIQFIHKDKLNCVKKISKKLWEPVPSTNFYWSLLKTILKGKKNHTYLLFLNATIKPLTSKKGMKILTSFHKSVFPYTK